MLKNNYEVEILVNGHPIKEYYHQGKIYVEGRKEQEYSIKIKNNGFNRILAIPSIDGLSVMNGELADFTSGGYVINSYSSIIIDGWRTSNDIVAKFYFADKNKSYANRGGKNGQEGVIGVAIFIEKQKEWFKDWYIDCHPRSFIIQTGSTVLLDSSSTVSCCYSSTPSSSNHFETDMGTGFGETKCSSVIDVEFEKSSKDPSEVFEIYYASRQSLKNIGVDLDSKPVYVYPNAFPGKFCQPPQK